MSSSIAEHYADEVDRHRRDFWDIYLARRSMAEAEDKVRRMCDAYRRHETDYGLPTVADDVLYEMMRIALAGLEGREPIMRFRIR